MHIFCVQWPLLRLNDFECPPLSLWAYSAEKLFLFRNSGKSADFPELPFHGWGLGTNSLREGAFGMVGKLLIAPEALAMCLKPWLSLRGKTSPAPGEDVAQRQNGESGAGAPERVIYSSCCSNPLTVSTVRAVKPAALMAAAASSKPKVSAAVSWASAVMSTLPPSLFHSPSSHAPG